MNLHQSKWWCIAGFFVACASPLPVYLQSPPPPPPDQTLDRGAIVRGPRDRKALALVFTAGDHAAGATEVLDALRARKAPGAFFLTGGFLRAEANRPLVERMRQEGHYVGPHSDRHLLYASWDSPPKLLVDRATFDADLDRNLDELEKQGIPRKGVRWFLPPYEHFTPEIADWTRARGMTLVNYSPGTRSAADYMEDDDPHFVPADEIVRSILDREEKGPDGLNGFLLLLHAGVSPKRTKDRMADKLPGLLDELAKRGYTFLRIDEMLR